MRFLNCAYAIEVLNGRLNGSSADVELNRTGNSNTSYVKKINGRSLVSANCQKFNIQRFLKEQGLLVSEKKKIKKEVFAPTLPHKFANEDIFGFMKAQNITITNEEYEQLDEDEKNLFVSNGKKGYKQNTTKKRKSKFLMSPLVNISNRQIATEFKVCNTSDDNMIYNVESYSGFMTGISNIDINGIGEFKISDKTSEFRDYTIEENINEDEITLNKDEKLKRIISAVKGLQFLSIEGNQNNYLTDTTPKVVILGEYSWGNNVFYGVIKDKGIDIEALKESIIDNEDFRISPIWIGISSKVYNENYKDQIEKLQERLKEDFIKIGTVGEAFRNYIEFLKETF
ncbi:DevR family CRISPR-associated autoregulator [Clostridium baratii]|uniref:CRISPR-associated autoregulator n=1 Tax=Clostridium baratii TaxID=1561 RepID=A0A174VB80_9CLOT|nr:DevR family CRISPR-associated autoregulator [Clostridium baratii]CUQ30411.1 CRISPR-associated autoregulator [Clostridium baratii]